MRLAACALVSCLVAASSAIAAPAPLKVGIASPFGSAQGAEQAKVIDAALEEALGRPVEVTVFPTAEKNVEALAGAKVDVAWTSSVGFLEGSLKAKLVPLASFVRRGSTRQHAVFVARDDGPKDLDHAAGKRVAWLGEASTSSLLARALLRDARLKTPSFFVQQTVVPNHAMACRQVLDGQAVLAVTFAYDKEPLQADGCAQEAGFDRLRVVASTPAVAGDLIAASASLAGADRDAVAKALKSLGNSEKGKLALSDAFRAEALADPDTVAIAAANTLLTTPAAPPTAPVAPAAPAAPVAPTK